MNVQRWGRLGAGLATLLAFCVYAATAARTITWRHHGADSGDLVTAAFTLGAPHPPGYPLYTLSAALFARLPFGEPAFGVAIFSALAASAAVFVLARAGSALLQPLAVSANVKLFSAVAAALGLAFAPLMWSQALIPEVYALNLFLVALLVWACLSTPPRRVQIAALTLGLGAAHHLSILLLAPGAWILLQPKRADARALLWFAAPLLLYAYLPLAASGNPPINWGDPVTPERFFWLTSAAVYRPYWFALDSADVWRRVAFSARALLDQFTVVGIAFVLWGAIQLALTRARVFGGLALMFGAMTLYAIAYASRDSFLYLLPALAIALLWGMYGVAIVLQRVGPKRWLFYALVGLVALLPLYNLVAHYAAMDVSQDRAAFDYARAVLEPLPADAVTFADGDEALFALWYYRYAMDERSARAVIVSQGLLQYDWYYDELRRALGDAPLKTARESADAAARAREIARAALGQGRAVCFTDSSPTLPQFEYETRGAVKCVRGEVGR